MVRETTLRAADLILPLFVSEKITQRQLIASMPGVAQLPVAETVVSEVRTAREDRGARRPTFRHSGAKGRTGFRRLRRRRASCSRPSAHSRPPIPNSIVITDVCLCEYMSHGHCGITERDGDGHFHVLNDASVELLARTAVSHAAAGADIVAPSDMMDGRVRAIRSALDARGFINTPVMSYASKFASSFYGPFRDAAEGAPLYGDRRTYQMDSGNAREALREAAIDVDESADLLIVKPGLPYLDILWRVKEAFGLPTAVYNVSGEYAMVKAAAANGWLDERAAVMEMMTSFKRAGADLIITYWAREVAGWLRE